MTTKESVDPLFTRDELEGLGRLYLNGQDPRQPLLSPAVHADLAGLPPLLLQAGSNEILLDDSTRLAALDRAGRFILDRLGGQPG